jgi:hypothetical protein
LVSKDIYKPHEILLEYPHPKHHGNEKIDTYIPSSETRNGLIMECKYDRRTATSIPRTSKAGKVFNDLYRLASFDIDRNARKWFIYLTDSIMSSYFINNSFDDFYNLDLKNELNINDNYLKNRPDTFIGNINKYGIGTFKIRCNIKENLPMEHGIRIYEIIN